MSIKLKIAFLFAILVTIILTIASISVYLFSVKERESSFRNSLRNRALSTARVYAGIRDNNFSVLQRLDAAGVASLNNKSISISDLNGSRHYMFADTDGDSLVLTQRIIDNTRLKKEYFFSYGDKKAVAVYNTDSSKNFIVAVAASDIYSEEYLDQLKKILLIAMLSAAVLSFFTGLLFAVNLIRPIKRLTGEVNLITSNNLSQRIETKNTKDELDKLAQTFNELMDRLQDSFAIQRRFISNASHELSTPLTSISSQLEVALQKTRTAEEYDEVMKSVHEDVQELQHLTRSLLDIAKAGSQGSLDLAEVRLDEVLFKVVSDVQKQNKTYKANLNFETFPEDEKLLTTFGNSNLLYIAFKNIIENGCKYADNHQSAITVQFEELKIIVKVANKGDVITESDIQNIFQPFFRTDSAVSKPGFGLGLTLTRRILALHKGFISVESDIEKGTVFTIQLSNILYPH
ncbi:MAG: HAMP domain-containing sensor histidine kinase [Ferruginibacter sp.]